MLAEQQEHPVEPQLESEAGGTGSAIIHGWSVVGYDRLVGLLRDDGERDKAIMTSPVLRVCFLGNRRTPVALTQSGSVYALGAPADSLGAQRAEHFLLYKAGLIEGAETAPAPRLPTSLMKI